MSTALKFITGTVLLVGAFGFLIYLGAGSSWVYYYSVDEFSEKLEEGEAAWDCLIRLAGIVEEGSVRRDSAGRYVEFELGGEASSIGVVYSGRLPANFSQGREVVVQGRYSQEGVFEAEEVLSRCESKYKVRLKEQ